MSLWSEWKCPGCGGRLAGSKAFEGGLCVDCFNKSVSMDDVFRERFFKANLPDILAKHPFITERPTSAS